MPSPDSRPEEGSSFIWVRWFLRLRFVIRTGSTPNFDFFIGGTNTNQVQVLLSIRI
jgi:hypothetical protein